MWIAGQNEEIGVEKNQLETIKSENISTSNSLQAQLNDIKRYFQADLQRMEEEFRVQARPCVEREAGVPVRECSAPAKYRATRSSECFTID